MNREPSEGRAAGGGGDHRSAVLAGFLGWTLDAFDFFLVVMCLTAIGREFHKSDKEMAVTLVITLAFRPVGASLAMEKVPARLRGLLSGLLQQGYSCGYLLAAVCYYFLFDHVGWRPLFFLGGLPALLALYVRMHVKESEVWERSRHKTWGDLRSAILSHWKLFLYIVALMTGMNLASHGTQDMYPTFLEREWGFQPTSRAALTAFSMCGAVAGGTLCGWFSDRWGRRRAMIVALLGAAVAVPLWAFAPSLALLWAGAFLMQFLVQGAWGVIPAHLSELSPDSVRGFLPGFAYQCGVLIAGSVSYLEAAIAGRTGYPTAMAVVAATVFLFAAAMTAVGRERRAAVFGGTA